MVCDRGSELDLKVLRAQIADVDGGIVRIPFAVRGETVQRGHWYRVSNGRHSVVVQVFGTKQTDPIIAMDMTLRTSLGVKDDGQLTRFRLSPVGLCGEIWSGWRRHPDVSVRVSTLLGLLSLALGLGGVTLAIVSLLR